MVASFAVLIQFIFLDKIIYPYAGLFGLVTLFSAYIGIKGVN